MPHELKSMFERQTRVEQFDLIQTFHTCKQEEGKSVSSYILKMKGYVEQLERLGYVLPQDISVGLIMNGLTSGRIQKANKKSLKGKGKGKDKGKDKHGYIPKPKNPKPSAKEHPTKDDTCHHCKQVGHWKMNYHVYLAELIKKKKQVGIASSSGIFDYALESATCILNMVPTKKGCEALVKRDTLDKLQQRSVKCIFIGYPKETMGYYFYFPPENKIIVTRVDSEETFSPVADIRAIRILIAIAAFYDYEIWQMDVKTAFLIGYLDEDIYMVFGEATFILGIKIYRDRTKRLIRLSQSAYMDKILKRFKMENSKRGNTSMQEIFDLNKTQGASTPEEVKRMQNVPYASTVGSIMYAVRCTRPDVAFTQNITSCFKHNPGEPHWTAVKTILKYLRNTKDMFLVYGGNPEAELRVDWYCNTRFETDRDDIKS
ncbi:retrotransposon protein, putative, ty1-copia subclass [Tanacetum coccineum]